MSGVTSAKWLMPFQRGASGSCSVADMRRSSRVQTPLCYGGPIRRCLVEIFAFRADLFTGSPIDLTDFDVESNDGEHIGNIDEATSESDVSYVIVDTGHWILG